MIAVTEIVNIEPIQEIEFSDHTKHRQQNVWVKSSDEDLQGSWTTFVKLFDEKIDENESMKVGDMVSISVTPTSRRLSNGSCVQSVILKLVGVARA